MAPKRAVGRHTGISKAGNAPNQMVLAPVNVGGTLTLTPIPSIGSITLGED
jgi:hypothetical protein